MKQKAMSPQQEGKKMDLTSVGIEPAIFRNPLGSWNLTRYLLELVYTKILG
jgi:hypothetical protein